MRLSDLAKIWPSPVRPTYSPGSRFMRIEEQGDRSYNADWTELRNITPERRLIDDSKNEQDERRSIDTTTTRISRAELQTPSRRWYAQGWRFGAINCACSVIIVFFINFLVSCWGSAHRNARSEVVFEEECHKGTHYPLFKKMILRSMC